MKNTIHYLLVSLALIPFVNNVLAQENTNQNELEEVVVIGSQLKGASITGALPVTVISSEDIEALGVDSGD